MECNVCNYITKSYSTLYLSYSAYYTRICTRQTTNTSYYAKLQTLLHKSMKAMLNYRQNYSTYRHNTHKLTK